MIPLQPLNILYNGAEKIIGSKDFSKFVVITRSRTGSNFLLTLLNSHKDIRVHGEMFSRLGNKNTDYIYKKIYPNKSLKKFVGFKIFYYHQLDSNDRSIWNILQENPSIKIIHLQRKNLLRVHTSRLIAEKTDIWSTKSEREIGVNEKKVSVDVLKVIEDFETTSEHIKKTKDLFKNHEVLDVYYENLVNNQEEETVKILRFLGAQQMNLKSQLKKQNPEKLKNLISNYEEVRGKVKDTEYSFWLKE